MSGVSLLPNRRSVDVSAAEASAAGLFFAHLASGETRPKRRLQAPSEFLGIHVDRPGTSQPTLQRRSGPVTRSPLQTGSTKPRAVAQSLRIASRSPTSSKGAATLPPGNSRRTSLTRCEQRSNRRAERPEHDRSARASCARPKRAHPERRAMGRLRKQRRPGGRADIGA